MRFAGQTDKGTIRSRNEDCFLLNGAFGLFIVADGIGGLADGDVASRICSDETNRFAERYLRDHPFPALPACTRMLADALTTANQQVYRRAHGNMGATCLATLLHKGVLSFAHAGDCKLYLLRRGVLRQLNREHSLVRELLDDNTLTEEQARTYRYRNVIRQAVGIQGVLSPETGQLQTLSEDRVVLMTDGIPGDLTREEMTGLLIREPEPEAVCAKLIEQAKQRRARDNLTVVVVDLP